MQAIVLAGGLGTRLRTVVADVPKSMAPVGGRPFLEYLLENLRAQGVTDVALAVGYLRETIIQHFGDAWRGLNIQYSIETEPLGTGGALKQAIATLPRAPTFVFNGDTWLGIDLRAMLRQHMHDNADVSVAVCDVPDVARYGAVEIADGRITAFQEKGPRGPGLINAGAYLLRPGIFADYHMPDKFSFERDFMIALFERLNLRAYHAGSDFIDIGIPEDYARAQSEVPRKIKKIHAE